MAVIEAIKTTYLEADGYIQWTSIPNTYKHLQIRGSFGDHNATQSSTALFTISGYVNNDNGYGFWATGTLYGKGYTATPHGSTGWIQTGYCGAEPNIPSSAMCVMDIMDYSSANKKTVLTARSGYVRNLNGINTVGMFSNVWHTATGSASTGINGAVDQILINSPGGAGLIRGSCFTLYGIND